MNLLQLKATIVITWPILTYGSMTVWTERFCAIELLLSGAEPLSRQSPIQMLIGYNHISKVSCETITRTKGVGSTDSTATCH